MRNPFVKTTLKSYRIWKYQPLNSGKLFYDIELNKSALFGLIRWTKRAAYGIPHGHEIERYTKHWDELIKNQAPTSE